MAFNIFKKKGKKACVIGLDGVPCSLLKDMMERGAMPYTKSLQGTGVLRDMTVSLPEISSVSWSTFMTGKNAGEHGIFGFTDLKENSYDLRFPMFRDLKTETIWDHLGKSGLKSVVINQPSTYPAREIPGVLISGFVAIDIDKALYPRKYLASLARARYEVDLDAQKCRDNPQMLFSELKRFLDCRLAIMDELWDKEDWNLMEVIVTGTDRLHHFIWDALEDPAHPHHKDFINYYSQVDEFIAHVHKKFLEVGDDNFFMLSDHGFCGTKYEVYINRILEEHGFLKFDGDSTELANISADSRAFALDPARVHIHVKGRYPKGPVDPGDVAAIKKELTAVFEGVEHEGTGTKIVRRVFDGAEVYSGPQAALGPDLLLIPQNGYDMKGRLGATTVVGERRLQGMHTWDDAFFFTTRKDLLSESEEFTIVDTPWKILKSLDVEP